MKPDERSAGRSPDAAVASVEDEQPVENEECPQAHGAWKTSGEQLGSVVAAGVGRLSRLRECVQTWQWPLAEDGGGAGLEEGLF